MPDINCIPDCGKRRFTRVDEKLEQECGSNSFYITGDYSGTATFDSLSVRNTGTGGTDIFVAKYDPTAAVRYVKQYAAGTGQDIDVLNNGCLYLEGGIERADATRQHRLHL